MDDNLRTSDIVKASYKTGEYVGEIMEQEDRRCLIKVLAVLRHPEQGDLHHPYDPDAIMFHERRALAYTEKVWVPSQAAKLYTGGALPEYRESLQSALTNELERLDRMKRWSERCMEQLSSLRKDYGM